MFVINLKNKMWMSVLFLTIASVWANSDGVELEAPKMSCEEALKILQEAKPASLTKDIIYDAIAAAIASIIQVGDVLSWHCKKFSLNEYLNKKTYYTLPLLSGDATHVPVSFMLMTIPMFPIISMVLSRFSNDSDIDKALDSLTSSQKSIEALIESEMNLEDVEKKIINLNVQEKKQKLILRIVECGILLIATYILHGHFLIKQRNQLFYKINRPGDLRHGKTFISVNLILECLIEMVAMGVLIHMQNSGYENSGRIQTLKKLKHLLEEVKSKNANEIDVEPAISE